MTVTVTASIIVIFSHLLHLPLTTSAPLNIVDNIVDNNNNNNNNDNSVLSASTARPGFSRACRGARTIGSSARRSPVVAEAAVVRVSPPRNNIYAVTMKVFTNLSYLVLLFSQSCYTNLRLSGVELALQLNI